MIESWDKIMATGAKISLFMLATCFTAHGQLQESGVYLSKGDYLQHILTYRINCQNEKHKINLYDYWHKPSITVIHNGKKYVHLKKDIFGFQDCDNCVFRFFKSEEYRIAENGSIIIYTVERKLLPGQGFKKVTDYYFSKFLDSDILPLTTKNLQSVYSENRKFCNLLNGNLKTGDPWIYDKAHKMYKINYLFEISQKP